MPAPSQRSSLRSRSEPIAAPTRLLRLACVVCVGLALSACPEATMSKPAAQCSKAYDKCTLPSGVLGICDVVDCSDNGTVSAPDAREVTPPCLACRSQH
jgi:hypothetical protein